MPSVGQTSAASKELPSAEELLSEQDVNMEAKNATERIVKSLIDFILRSGFDCKMFFFLKKNNRKYLAFLNNFLIFFYYFYNLSLK